MTRAPSNLIPKRVTELEVYDGTSTDGFVPYALGGQTYQAQMSWLLANGPGHPTSIVGITGTKAQFDTALLDGNFLYVGDITPYTNEEAQDAVGAMAGASLVYNDVTPSFVRAALTGAITAAENSNTTTLGSFTLAQLNTALSDADVATGGGTATGTNTGDQTSVSGNAGTATALQTSRNFSIAGSGITAASVGFDGTANVVLAASVDSGHITLARMADVATSTVFYRKTAGTGAPEVQTLATLKTDLGLSGTNTGDQTSIVGITGTLAQFDTACTDANFLSVAAAAAAYQPLDTQLTDLAGLAYASNALKVVRVNAGETGFELAAIGSLTDGDKGDITVSGSGATWTIDNSVVTLAKMADVATSTVFYRKTAGTGVPEVQTLATLKTDLGLTGTNSGDQTITLTGDVTGSGTGSFAATLATVNGSPQTDQFRKITVNGKGLVTATSAVSNSDINTAHGSQTANFFLAAPDGSAGNPSFRAVVAADIPTLNQNTTGSAATLTTSRNFSISGSGITAAAVGFNGSANVVLAASVDAGHITLARMADVATSTVFYRKTAGTGAPEVQTLATLKTDLGLTGTNSGDQTITLTGDVTGSGTGSFAATIANDAVTNAKMANVATATFKGRTTAGTGDPEDLTATQATALLDVFTSVLKGLAPASGGGTSNFLRADGTWAAPSGGGGGGINSGSTTVDFGAFPGKSDTSVAITGQTSIAAGSKVKAYIMATATSDHSADEHWVESIDVMAGNIIAGTGFTIYAKNTNTLFEPSVESWANTRFPGPGAGPNQPRPNIGGGAGTLLYGQFTVAWEWI